MADVTIPSVRGGVVEKYLPGDRWTATVLAAQSVTGGQLVEGGAGDRVVRAAQADSLVSVGVALHDAAAGEKVTVASQGVWLLTASGAISAGQRIKCGAAGVAVGIAADGDPRFIIGVALSDIANGQQGPVRIF